MHAKLSRVKSNINVEQFLEHLKHALNLQTAEDWNSLTSGKIKANGGQKILKKYSTYELKCIGYPSGKLIFNKSKKIKGYWDDKENIKNFLTKLGEKLNFKTPNDWNLLTTKILLNNKGYSIISKYSIYELKCIACPEGKNSFDSPYRSVSYWDDNICINEYLLSLKNKLNLKTIQDWNELTHKTIKSNGGNKLLENYSIYQIKCMGCPEGKEIFSKNYTPSGFWDDKLNVIHFLNEIKHKLNLNSPMDWNLKLNQKQIKFYGGKSLLNKYSLFDLKVLGCPEGKDIFEKLSKPSGYWKNKENVKNFLLHVGKLLNFSSVSDWNSLTSKHIKYYGGLGLFNSYSLYELKCLACPEGSVIFNQRKQKEHGFWNNQDSIHSFINDLKTKYNLYSPQDWSRLSKEQIVSSGGGSLFFKYSLSEIIQLCCSEKVPRDRNIQKSSQRWLFLQIQKLFPNEEIIEDFFHSAVYRDTGFPVQFDVFLVDRNIAIEYHGMQHYEDVPQISSLEMYKTRDEEKQKLCNEFGIQLIIIPYWWDNNLDSLKETIFSKILANKN